MTKSFMTKTFSLTYGVNPTKAEEIAIVAKLVETFGSRPDWYIADLFTPEFLEYVTAAINNDIPPNVIEVLRAADRRANDNEAALREQTLATESADRRAKMWEATCASATQEFNLRITHLNDTIDDDIETIRAANNRLSQYEDRIAELEAAELKLKAHLYDLMTAAAAK